MILTVEHIKKVQSGRFLISARLADDPISAFVECSDSDELESFTIEGRLFRLLLYFGGLEGNFSRQFFEYRECGTPQLPWQIGNLDREAVARALEGTS